MLSLSLQWPIKPGKNHNENFRSRNKRKRLFENKN